MPIGIGLGTAIAAGVGGASTIYAAHTQSKAAGKAGDLQAQAEERASKIQEEAARQALEFQKQQEATRAAEFQQTQQQNFRLSQEELDYKRMQDEAAIRRRAPFLNTGYAALGQLRTPIGANGGRNIGQLIGGGQ